ncbi:MAG: hypothetical protein HYV04_14160, partial [Deltaproteobacteria bacterium]|nr:hypothetical protein [Deltaproteobacteria bacterium]
AVVGAIVFSVLQVVSGRATITEFMGQQIVSQGGYPEWLTVPIGWGIHLGVSLAYSLLFVIIMLVPFSRAEGRHAFFGLIIAALLGWISTLLTAPAITATISLLTGQGFPASLPDLNTSLGLPFWNHMLFFGVVWLIYLYIPYVGRKY